MAGSAIRAAQIAVRSGATFGSAELVIGNIAVAGRLIPGALPGTMTVTGNVSLASGSVSLSEITPTVADKLVINGGLSIASGSTLRIVADGAIRPGTSYDLIVASGGINGSYTTIDKSASLFGFVVQRADRIKLLGQFLGDPRSTRRSRAASTMPMRRSKCSRRPVRCSPPCRTADFERRVEQPGVRAIDARSLCIGDSDGR